MIFLQAPNLSFLLLKLTPHTDIYVIYAINNEGVGFYMRKTNLINFWWTQHKNFSNYSAIFTIFIFTEKEYSNLSIQNFSSWVFKLSIQNISSFELCHSITNLRNCEHNNNFQKIKKNENYQKIAICLIKTLKTNPLPLATIQ